MKLILLGVFQKIFNYKCFFVIKIYVVRYYSTQFTRCIYKYKKMASRSIYQYNIIQQKNVRQCFLAVFLDYAK
jgi:hypothetical protein